MLPAPLQPLAAWSQFLLYKLVPRDDGRTDKFPVSPWTGEVVDAHDRRHWVNHAEAEKALAQDTSSHGIAFVFTEDDPFFFVDVDHAFENGQWSTVAQDIYHRLSGCAIEVSQSGTGLHLFGSYSGNEPSHACKNVKLGLELYTSKRFVALTGNMLIQEGSAGTVVNTPLADLIATYYAPSEVNLDVDWRTEPMPGWHGHEDDDLLIEKMLQSGGAKSVFGNSATFRDLWEANEPVLSKAYPSLNNHDPYDRSSADAALAQHLAFWTGKNHDRMLRLMWRSGLVRDKWKSHKSFLQMTITNAVNRQIDVYSSTKQKAGPAPEMGSEAPITPPSQGSMTTQVQIRTGQGFMSIHEQAEYFSGCVYIQAIHRVITPQGTLLKPDQFRATYGGYLFSMDAMNETTSKSAWEAFIENRGISFPKVNESCFRPELPPGMVVEEEGLMKVNTYVPIETPRVKGDVSPMLDLLARLLPNDRDRRIMLSYMAALVQNPGIKFQWCPLLQGTQGNGKTFLVNCLANAVGHRYTHFPNANDLGGNGTKFNAWIQNKLLIGIEEIFTHERREVTEAMKPLITNSRIEIQGKGDNQITGDNRANFIMCSNHKEALQITNNDRRYAIFYTAQQSKDDKIRDGMAGEYFPRLYAWARSGGWAYITDFLLNYEVEEEFNPAGKCQEAPQTSSTMEAIRMSLGGVEQEVMEAIEEGRPGFAGGWVSSLKLDQLLEGMRATRMVPRNKRKGMMETLGYTHHPGLPDGRLSALVAAEGGRPRLYIRIGHPYATLTDQKQIVAQYMVDQQYPTLTEM